MVIYILNGPLRTISKINGSEYNQNGNKLEIDCADIILCRRKNNKYYIHTNSTYYEVAVEQKPDFEAMFPEFPYNEQRYQFKQLSSKIEATNLRIDALVSHMEAAIIALGQRPASAESLEI
jgi:hypothetical protein